MSKEHSDAEMKRKHQEELERLRQERLRKIREETDKLNAEISSTKVQINRIDKHFMLEIRNLENVNEMASIIQEISRLKNSYIYKLTKALDINVPTEPDAISICGPKLANITKNAVANYFNEVKWLEERILDYNKQLEIQNKFALASKMFSAEREKMNDVEDFDFTIKLDNVAHSNIVQNVKEKAEQMLSEIDELVNSESIQESDMKSLLAIANNIYKTAFETNNSFEAAAIEYQIVKPQIVRNISIFDDLYQDYYAEYIAFMDLLNKNKNTPMHIAPLEKYDFDSIGDLQCEIDLLSQKAKNISEKNYIREQIDDVMRLFNYDMSEEIIFDASQTGNHYICENKSGQSAVHIYMSDKKQIMMEIVDIGSGNNSSSSIITTDLDNREKEALLLKQGSFCELHPKIVAELGKRGVILNRKSRKPPDLNSCKKIIPATSSKSFNDSGAAQKHSSGQKATKCREMKLRRSKL
jgi:hypothetical protein